MMQRVFEPISSEVEALAKQAVDACLKVHRALGPGLLESVYVMCLAYELRKRGLKMETEVPVDAINSVFKAQVLTYLKLMNLRLGLLINFNSELIKDGIERVAD